MSGWFLKKTPVHHVCFVSLGQFDSSNLRLLRKKINICQSRANWEICILRMLFGALWYIIRSSLFYNVRETSAESGAFCCHVFERLQFAGVKHVEDMLTNMTWAQCWTRSSPQGKGASVLCPLSPQVIGHALLIYHWQSLHCQTWGGDK